MERAVCRSPVEIIGVDDNERTIDAITSGEHGVSGSPGFLSPRSDADARLQIAYGGPVSDTFGLRFAGSIRDYDGWLTNTNGPYLFR